MICLILPAHELYVKDLAQSEYSSDNHIMAEDHIKTVNIGVVIDMGSWIGKSILCCIKMAISDFYASKQHNKTQLVLHSRDSRGDPRHAISSAAELLESVKLQALIMGPETVLGTKSLGALGNKANIPIFSFSSIPSSPHPFLIQVSQDETLQFKAIASILSWHEWRTVSVIYEDTDDAKYSVPHLVGSFQERSIRVSHRTAISPFSTDDQILDELHKLANLQQIIFVVHLSPSNTYRLFSMAKGLGMMREGYVWIVSDKTMNQLSSADWGAVQSMQGVVGVKAYIPSTSKLQDFSLRWKKECYRNNPKVEYGEVDVLGIWAYDAVWALAENIEVLGHTTTGKELLDVFARTKFSVLSDQHIVDGRLHSEAFELVNVIGKGERSVGFWTLNHGLVKRRSLSSERFGLEEAIVWPGITTVAPRGRLMLANGRKLRIAVLNSSGFKELLYVQQNNNTNTASITGFCVDVFHAVIDTLDYQVAFEFIPYVDQHGNNLGSYSNLVYELYLEKYDGIIGDITITGSRSVYVDFTVTYTDLGTGTIIKRESSDSDFWLFLRPLHPDLWFGIAAFPVLTGLVVWIIEHSSNKEFQGSVAYQIGTILWFGFSTLFYAQRERLSSNLSRLVVIVWLFAVLILTSTYTATLSSMLTVQKIQLGLEGEYIGTHADSFVGRTIANNLNFKDDRLQLYGSPEEYADALSRGIKKGGIGAIIDEIPYLKVFLAKYGNKYAMVATQSTTSGFGFAFQKKHSRKKYAQLVSDLSQAIIKLREEGQLAKMENTWIKSASSFMTEAGNAATRPSTLNYQSFRGLFIITSACSGFVIFMRLVFIILKRLGYLEGMGSRARIPFLKLRVLFFIISLLPPAHELSLVDGDFAPSDHSDNNSSMMTPLQNENVNVGVVIDMGSWIGKSIHSCIELAISDFCASKLHCNKTRLVLHTRDSRGDPKHAISSGQFSVAQFSIALLENIKVQALIVGPETVLETKYLGALGNKAKVPIFSFSSTPLSSPADEYPFFIQINQDEKLQFKAIASILISHQWKTVSVIYDDTEDGRYSIPSLVGSFQERGIRVSHRTAVSPFSNDDQILDKLHKLSILQQTIFVVHLSASSTYRLFPMAKRLGMMKEGYAWIVTDRTMNQLQYGNGEVIPSMQGVVGLKAYIPSSSKLLDFSLKWKKEFYSKNPSVEFGELNVLGVWAYDTIWALAEKFDRHEYSSGKRLLDDFARTRFSRLSGEFEIMDGRLHSESYEVVNVIGKGERSVGFWSLKHDMVDRSGLSSSSTSPIVGLDGPIVWPGITTAAPRGLLMLANGRKLRIAVIINEGFEQFVSLKQNSVTNRSGYTGLCIDVFLAVMDSLPYQVAFEFIPWKDIQVNNGSYNDLVYQLYLERIDGLLGDVTITGNRSLYADFTVTYTDIGIGTIIKRGNNDDIWFFSKPLQPDLWVVIVAFLVLTGSVVWLIEHSSNPEFQGPVIHQIGTIIWFGFSTLFYAHRERLTSNLSSDIELYVDVAKDSTRIGRKYADALSKGSKRGGVDAIADEIPYLKIFLAKYGDEYAMVATQSITNGFGFAFSKKHSQLVSDMSQAIIKLREEGKLAEMEDRWINQRSSLVPNAENAATQPTILNLRNFGGLFLICSSCCALVLLIRLGSVLLNKLEYLRNMIRVLRDGGAILTYMLNKIAPTHRPIQTH
ncbi:OLC1v1006585C1 [Oldenlandia corymbosa var. corymbosa]|uniref:OLC1v1006585C1 n=1 Tax=Oldenlandia corymbosa var. corymbosa TaxID=529605 RepID=A0AAV1DKD6_OLDCO|nr:OLC1v1006585C1 [Oldenlandia corymbosa var. corymbosa]